MSLAGTDNAGARWLTKIRLGTLITGNDLARMRKAQREMGKCLVCEEATEETPGHILLDCALHMASRERYMGNLMALVSTGAPRQWRLIFESWLLRGGRHQNLRWLEKERGLRRSYLNEIASQREAATWDAQSRADPEGE